MTGQNFHKSIDVRMGKNNGIFISRSYIKNKAGFISPIVQTRLPALHCKNYFLKIVLVLFVKVTLFLVITVLPSFFP